MKVTIALLSSLTGLAAAKTFTPNLGFGISSLQSRVHKIHSLMEVPGEVEVEVDAAGQQTCPGVENLYYKEALRDNFASNGKEQFWYYPQRYWISKEFWAGPGSPILGKEPAIVLSF
jgi:hypothetical protein